MTERHSRGRAFLAAPLILVNLAAVWGQAGWAYDNITRGGGAGVAVAVLFAFAVESIGVYLAWESHESLMADQASALLRLGSYAVGVLAGVLNFLHFSAQSLATGVAFGALSAISPWLWAIWSRARNRTRLAELGLVDVRGVRLSTSRKLWHPRRSLAVIRWAAWAGVTDPRGAVEGWELSGSSANQSADMPGDLASDESQPAPARPHLVASQPASLADRAAPLIAKRYGRQRLADELGVTPAVARSLLETAHKERA